MNRLLVAVLIALSGGAASASECANSEPRPLDLDLTGIERVEFDLGGSTLRLHAGASPSVRAVNAVTATRLPTSESTPYATQ